jgi:hypothetical protein
MGHQLLMRPDRHRCALPDWKQGLPPRAHHEIPTTKEAQALHSLQLGVIAIQGAQQGATALHVCQTSEQPGGNALCCKRSLLGATYADESMRSLGTI